MKVLVTGAAGFIGKNLVSELKSCKDMVVYEYDIDSGISKLNEYCRDADFVFHLAGVNRPENNSEYIKGNFGFTRELLKILKMHHNTCPVMLSSSIQAELDNPYGTSKKAGEDLLFNYSWETGAKVLVYRFPNVFGKWCRPNYNSVVATFCHNIAHGLPIVINNPDTVLKLAYIDDVVTELISALNGRENRNGKYCEVRLTYKVSLGEIASLLYSFKESRNNNFIPDMGDPFVRKLYSTYISYLPDTQFSYPLKMNVDYRGSFTEFIKAPCFGQVSINISKPGIIKGNHWHHTKNEKFLVVSGKGVIRFRRADSADVIEYHVSGDRLEVVDVPAGYAHSIENTGSTDLVTVMWANECFDPQKPDTKYLEV